MGFGFLGNLASGIGHGIKSGVGFLGKLPGKLQGAGMGGDEDEGGGRFGGFGSDTSTNRRNAMGMLGKLGPGGTAGFNPDAALPVLGEGGAFRGMKGAPPVGDSGLINRSQPMPNALPRLEPTPAPTNQPIQLEPLRESVGVTASLPAGNAEVSPLAGQMIPQRQINEVRPPNFMGRKGATMDDTPLNHERYAYQTQYMENGHNPRRWQDILMSGLHSAAEGYKTTGDWAGALGGFGAGAAGAGISPIHARDYRFRQEQLPRLEKSRADYERGQDRKYELEKRSADLEGTRARTAATIAGMKDADLERQYRKAQIGKMDAQAEAARLGKPVVKMITDEDTGEIYEAQIYPDGRIERRGLSGTADLRQQGYQNRRDIAGEQIRSREGIADKQIKSREKIVGMQQGGANYRAGMSQSGQDRRSNARIQAQYGDAPPVGSVPNGGSERRQAIIRMAIEAGLTAEQAAAEADKRGIK